MKNFLTPKKLIVFASIAASLLLAGLIVLLAVLFTDFGRAEQPTSDLIDEIPYEEQLVYDAAAVAPDESEQLLMQENAERALLAEVEAEMILSGAALPFEIRFVEDQTFYAVSATDLYAGPDENDFEVCGSLSASEPVTVMGRVTSYRPVIRTEDQPSQAEASDKAGSASSSESASSSVGEAREIDWFLAVLPGTDRTPAFLPADQLTDTDPYAAARLALDESALPVEIRSCRIDTGASTVTVRARLTGTVSGLEIPENNYTLFVGTSFLEKPDSNTAGASLPSAASGSSGSALDTIDSELPADTGSTAISDDGLYHLIAQGTYVSGAAGFEVATAPALRGASFTFPLNKNSAASVLEKRFVICVKKDDALVPVSGAHYITNPEACSTYSAARNDHGKKGILPASSMVYTNDLVNLGVQQVTYNLNLGELCSGGGLSYTYNGRTYSFNYSMISGYDRLIQRFNSMGIQVTMILLNNKTGDQTLIHPSARGGSAHYYALNSDEEAGAEKLAAVMAFLSSRYAGVGNGQIDNWIIGNEINAQGDWNYLAASDVTAYAAEYAEGFRICYNAIRGQNAGARVYTCIDQQWAQSIGAKYYPARSFLNAFNANIVTEGNIAWHLAAHPYDYPLTDPVVWNQHSKVTHSSDTPFLTMRNVEVLTDYLCQSHYLTPAREVRSVLLSEVGYSSSRGEGIQAASVVYAFLQAQANQHVDGFILSREQDHGTELAEGLAFGIVNKIAYSFYQGIDGPNAQSFIDQASAVIGVADLRSLLTAR